MKNQNEEAKERDKIDDAIGLHATSIYKTVSLEGQEELSRPATSLWWSGVAAGIAISLSVLCEAFFHHLLPDTSWRPLIENLGYTVGFVLVILGRLQLFTENTITVILPLLSNFSNRLLLRVTKLWGIVFSANMVGTLIAAFSIYYGGVVTPEFAEASMSLSRHFAEKSPSEALLQGIPAGFLIAALVWTMPSASNKLLLVMFVTYFIALGEFAHVIAGSTEVFLLLLSGEMSVIDGVVFLIAPTLIGNVIGGTCLFTMLAYGQVHEEM